LQLDQVNVVGNKVNSFQLHGISAWNSSPAERQKDHWIVLWSV